MSELSLFQDLPVAKVPPFYFALRPDAETASSMIRLAREILVRTQSSGRIYSSGRLHVSLCPVGLYGLNRGDIHAARHAADHVSARPFPIRFDMLVTVPGRGGPCLVLRASAGSAGLDRLVATLRGRLVQAGLALPRAGYDPHVTLIRQTSVRPEPRLDTAIEWTARQFVLARLGGSSVDDVECWSLGG